MSQPGIWQAEINDLARAFGGAFLFGMPLLYTMEMWWIATYIEIWKLLAFFALALGANVLLGQIARRRRNLTWGRALAEAVENVAIGMVAAGVVLFALGRIAPGDPPLRLLTKVLLHTLPLSVGAAVTHSTRKGKEKDAAPPAGPWQRLQEELSGTIAGALFVAFTLAPILEVTVLAARADYWHELLLIALGLLLSYLIVYKSGLDPGEQEPKKERPALTGPLADTLMAYAAALLVALLTLYLFDRIHLSDPLGHALSQAVVLALPAAIGGAAGRKVI